jgi:DNA invertase Pin-like site-specific DNA recombinase
MSPEELAKAQQLLATGNSPEQTAKELGIHHSTLLRKIGEAGYKIERTYHLVPRERVQLPAEVAR